MIEIPNSENKDFMVDYYGDEKVQELGVELWYPSGERRSRVVRIGLSHVRAADDLHIWFDFDRDSWIVEMRLTVEDGGCSMDEIGPPEEIAVLPSWNEKKPTDLDPQCSHHWDERPNGYAVCYKCHGVAMPGEWK